MPRYEYRCESCGADGILEHFNAGAAPREVRCPRCFAAACRVWQPPAAIHFKGPGFYETDVRGKLHRRRRKNPGDHLPKPFDHAAAYIADHL